MSYIYLENYYMQAPGIDDTSAFNYAMNDCNFKKTLVIPTPNTGDHVIKSTVINKARGIGANAPFIDSGAGGGRVTFKPDAATKYDLMPAFDFQSGTDIRIENVAIWGDTNYSLDNLTTYVDKTLFDQRKYSMFAPGVASIRISGDARVSLKGVSTRNSKIGLLLDSTKGHIYGIGTNYFGGLIGIYCRINSGDYYFEVADITGVFAGVMYGVKSHAGHSGGFGVGMTRVHMGFSPYGFYQVIDDETNYNSAIDVEGLDLSARTVQFEQIGESCIEELPKAKANLRIADGWGLSWSINSYNTPRQGWQYCLPDSLKLPAERQQYAARFGTLGYSEVPRGSTTGNLFMSNSIGAKGSVYIEKLTETSNLDGMSMDYAVIKSKSRDAKKTYSLDKHVSESNHRANKPLSRGNLLKNTDTLANYNVLNGALSIVTDLTTLPAPLSSAMIYELGRKPVVFKFVPNGSSPASVKIDFIGKPVKFDSTELSMSVWLYAASGGIGTNVAYRTISTGQYANAYGGTTYPAGKWSKVLGQEGTTPSSDIEYYELVINMPTSGTVYFCAPMINEGVPAAYSPTNHISADTSLEFLNAGDGPIFQVNGVKYKLTVVLVNGTPTANFTQI